MKNISAAFILLIFVAAISFYGGIKYQEGKQRFFFQRRINGQGQLPNSPQGFRPVNGEIIENSESSITVKLPDGSSKIVLISEKTTINKAREGSKADLKNGEKVMVFGQENPDGSITAQNIQLNPNLFRRNRNQ